MILATGKLFLSKPDFSKLPFYQIRKFFIKKRIFELPNYQKANSQFTDLAKRGFSSYCFIKKRIIKLPICQKGNFRVTVLSKREFSIYRCKTLF